MTNITDKINMVLDIKSNLENIQRELKHAEADLMVALVNGGHFALLRLNWPELRRAQAERKR